MTTSQRTTPPPPEVAGLSGRAGCACRLGSEAAPPEASEGGLTRRAFLHVLGAGLVITVLPFEIDAQTRPASGGGRGGGRGGRGGGGRGGAASVAARIHVGKDGTITVLTGKVEGGQGARAELTQAAAEELRVPAGSVELVMADTGQVPDDGMTAGSRSTPSTVPAVRQGAAAARELLVALAVARWASRGVVDRKEVEVRDGKAVYLGDIARAMPEVTYADLAADDQVKGRSSSRSRGPGAGAGGVELTAVKEWKVLGTAIARPHARDLVTGAHRFPSDTVRPSMLYGKVLRPPAYGATLKAIDLAPAKAIAGAVVVQDGSFVGVAASTTFAAEAALAALAKAATWELPAGAGQPSSTEVFDHLRQHARGGVPKNPFPDELAAAAKKLHETYHVAYVQHAPLEPRTAAAEWDDAGKLTVWTGSQNPFGCQAELVRTFGLTADRVRVIVPDFGGGFGGKHMPDAHIEAARLAKAAGKPVLVRWTRAEEFTWAYFRPAAVIDIEASLDAKGALTSWHFVNINAGGAGIETPYRSGKARSQSVSSSSPLRQGSYRALAATANNFARESFMDELAAASGGAFGGGADPLAFRLAHLDNPRLKAVLEAAAKRFDWATQRAKKAPGKAGDGVGVGLACGTEKGSYVAACAEVHVKDGTITVRRVCEVFECGAILNPGNLLSQVQGCIVMGLGPALREQMEFEKGRVLKASFWRYLVPRMADLPELDIELLNRPDLPSVGAGETPIIAIAPAIANAVFHATGQRIRQMPLKLPEAAKP